MSDAEPADSARLTRLQDAPIFIGHAEADAQFASRLATTLSPGAISGAAVQAASESNRQFTSTSFGIRLVPRGTYEPLHLAGFPGAAPSHYNPDVVSTWEVGSQVGPYVLLAGIGAGGMGDVWKARDTRLDRIVAIKRLRVAGAAIEREARTIAGLNHPHICTLHDIGSDYLVMEYVDGAPLTGPMAPAEAVRIALQIASALEAAHSKGIISNT